VVLRLLRGESVEGLSRELGVEIYRLEKWRDKGLAGIDAGLKERVGDPVSSWRITTPSGG
jgi:transposase